MNATIYTKDHCGFCIRAKRLMEETGIAYTEINIMEQAGARDQLLTECAKIEVVPKTVPQIWLNEEYVGGFTELRDKLDDDMWEDMPNKAHG